MLDQHLRILSANNIFFKKFGSLSQKEIGLDVISVLESGGWKWEHLRKKLTDVLSKNEGLTNIEVEAEISGKGHQYYIINAQQINWHVALMPKALLLSIEDITERIFTDKRMQRILEAAPDAIVIINQNGKINYINTQTEKIFGFTKDELIGQVVETLIPEPYRSRHPKHRGEFFKNPRSRAMGTGMELFGQRKNLEIFPVEISLSPLETREGTVALASIRDITERKKIDKMKNEFISMVSHELRTPLTSIQGALGLLNEIDKDMSSDTKKLLDIAKKNSERLTLLINDILDIEKIEANKIDLQLHHFGINEIAKEAVSLNQSYGEVFGVKIKLFTSNLDLIVNVDRNRILQVFANLLSNAIKFSKKGDEVTVNISQHDKNVRVAVKDNGPGIPKDFQSHIFEKFAQADTSAKRIHGGTGLGLSITKAILEKHGGSLHFKTKLNQGTTFYFDLPIQT